jgi:hypothetical protein
MRSFIFYTPHQILLGRSNQGEWGGRDMWHVWERRGMCTRFKWESQMERDHLEDQGVNGRLGSEWVLGRLAEGVYNGSSWLRIGTSGGLLWIRWWTFGFWRHGVSFFSMYESFCERGVIFLIYSFIFTLRTADYQMSFKFYVSRVAQTV